MLVKGFQINLSSDDEDLENLANHKPGLASNHGQYGETLINYVKRQVSSHEYEEDWDEED